tara:strand:- start:463 stop:591 length:129 start_codon:yes stop_codon:yes gene_type:complete
MDGTWMQLFGQIDKLHRSFWLKARSRKKTSASTMGVVPANWW